MLDTWIMKIYSCIIHHIFSGVKYPLYWLNVTHWCWGEGRTQMYRGRNLCFSPKTRCSRQSLVPSSKPLDFHKEVFYCMYTMVWTNESEVDVFPGSRNPRSVNRIHDNRALRIFEWMYCLIV